MVVVLVYFVYLALLSLFMRVPAKRRLLVFAISLATVTLIAYAGLPHLLPLAYLLVGYWLPGLLVAAPNLRAEQHLLDFDRRLFGAGGIRSFAVQAPRLIVDYLELAYLLCYAVVPAGYLWLVAAGFADQAEQFWSVVLLASFICYGLLPWIPTRAPRVLEPQALGVESAVRRLNLAVLSRASVQWNTFPSGHTAASIATALAVGHHVPWAGFVLMAIAVSIAAGSVAGRYHYAADALAGAIVAIAAFVMASGALAR